MNFRDFILNLPEVIKPAEKKLSFNTKLKWTIIILASFFTLANIPLFGLATNALERFEYLAIIFGTDFGSVISLGIGPIVMASIILQLLAGSKILNVDLKTSAGKEYFQGLQKLLTYFFIVFEAMIYVLMKGLQASPGMETIMIVQLVIGGVLIMFMDEVSTKYGFGSGVSLFIVAGVGWRLFTQAFGFMGPGGQLQYSGRVLVFFISIAGGDATGALKALATVAVTIFIFLVVVWAQSIKVEVPLSFEKIRGFAIKWPLAFFYTSVIPVILAAALMANVQLFARLAENSANSCLLGDCGIGGKIASGMGWLGKFNSQGMAESGLSFWISAPHPTIIEAIITGSFRWISLLQAFTHLLFFVAFSVLFAVFWVRTSGMDARNQAEQILSSGLHIPGFRRDPRILESILSRYILPLTVMGGAAIGILASVADMLGALVSGTAILLGVMIIYKMYQDISQQHAVDMHPMLRKSMK
ncbi:MAG: preprotein translocase subunit SecY [archaeon]